MNNIFVKKQYDKVADNYLAKRDQFKNTKYLDKLNTLIPKNSTILDIGCGAGIPIDKYFIDKGHKVIGIDISEKQINLAKKNLPEGRFEVKDMSELKNGEYKLDAVVSFYAIFHTDRKKHQEIINKIYSFLTKGGYILITMGSGEWEGKENDFFGDEMWWSHYGREKNIEMVKKAGFEISLNEVDDTGGEKHLVIIAKKPL